MNHFRKVIFAGLAILMFAMTAFAQAPANLRGQVKDPSGAAIPNASVTVTGPNGSE